MIQDDKKVLTELQKHYRSSGTSVTDTMSLQNPSHQYYETNIWRLNEFYSHLSLISINFTLASIAEKG
jgi:hypothetical protein